MRKALAFPLALLLALLAFPALAQTAAEKPAAAPAAGGVRAEILRHIDDAQEKLLALAEATPADKFTWRPNDKVRSTSEVFMHVAGGNYFLPTFWGVKPPEGLGLRELEKETDKTKVIDAVKKSFAHAHKAIESVSDADLERTIKLFGQDATVRGAMMVVATHAHEHLGQSIAYARMSGIVPPWSAGGGQ